MFSPYQMKTHSTYETETAGMLPLLLYQRSSFSAAKLTGLVTDNKEQRIMQTKTA